MVDNKLSCSCMEGWKDGRWKVHRDDGIGRALDQFERLAFIKIAAVTTPTPTLLHQIFLTRNIPILA
jgi:hypothetical protein